MLRLYVAFFFLFLPTPGLLAAYRLVNLNWFHTRPVYPVPGIIDSASLSTYSLWGVECIFALSGARLPSNRQQVLGHLSSLGHKGLGAVAFAI